MDLGSYPPPNFDLIQADRLIRVETPLGADVLVADSAIITERTNGNFEIRDPTERAQQAKAVAVGPDRKVRGSFIFRSSRRKTIILLELGRFRQVDR